MANARQRRDFWPLLGVVDLVVVVDVDLDGDGDVNLVGEPSARSAAVVDTASWSDADSANRYEIARGEAMECAASLDVLRLRKLITNTRYERGIRLVESVVSMLTEMV